MTVSNDNWHNKLMLDVGDKSKHMIPKVKAAFPVFALRCECMGCIQGASVYVLQYMCLTKESLALKDRVCHINHRVVVSLNKPL